jgi:poly(A) polymerase
MYSSKTYRLQAAPVATRYKSSCISLESRVFRTRPEGVVDERPTVPQGTHGTLDVDRIDADALRVVRRLLSAGHEAYLVGGCVRDLYLRLEPKDFDIATSATPENIRRLFRNSRIIGRRFKLAHVFFGSKIIETSTFRAAPPSDGSDDLLITQDNVWGSVEDDARRRDFTINGLFFDIESERIVDFVDGLDDLDGRLIRTIGDPEQRFREDPVRMIRAVKFAARLDFRLEDESWRALLECASDITRCSKARVLEEIYKLLRGGSARRTFELMLATGLLQYIMPSYASLYGAKGRDELERVQSGCDALARSADAFASPSTDDDGEISYSPAQLLWRFLATLDEYVQQTKQVVGNGVLQAMLFAPLVNDDLANGQRQRLDRRIESLMTPMGTAMGVSRRDRELARQILMAHRRMVDTGGRRRRRASLAQRQYFHDALIFLGLAVRATGGGGSELARWQQLAAVDERDEQKSGGGGPRGRRRRRRGGRKRGDDSSQTQADTARDG